MAVWPALILSDVVTGKEWVMSGDRKAPYTIGRSSRCDFTVADVHLGTSVSGLHAKIDYDEDLEYWSITDLGSKAGTLVIKGSQVLQIHDTRT